MILCDMCDKYLFPEPDEDGIWSAGCRSPSVITEFMNFFRLKKCKYYRKISYSKLLERCKFLLSNINSYSFHYRDSKYRKKLGKFNRHRLEMHINDYLEFRNYLFKELLKEAKKIE